ncbi:right-handed parallel beta-helix repeat-containing protein [Streptomyces sp. NPDC017979]|uniref:right-handed parallel beta-helix repeat-containing protein n=1 Tax=Streptomyces sp. NPDC017979 TaxID=3365024 RepID=UPI0037B6AE10
MIRNVKTLSSGWFAATGAIALFSVVLPAGPAHAAPLSCGQTVTTSVVLQASLLNCPGDGLVVGAGGITVDLNGHTVDGIGLGVGIRNDGFDGVTLTNSSSTQARVQEFDYGVRLNPGTSGGVVEKLAVQNNEFGGIELNGADTNTQVRNNLIERQAQRGVTLTGGTRGAAVVNNTISANRGVSVFVENSADNRLEGNRISGSGDAGLVLAGSSGNTLLTNTVGGSSDAAIRLQLGSNNNLVQGNSSSQNADAGLTVSDSNGNRLLSNDLRGSGDSGIVLQSAHHTTVTGNDVSRNTGGIELRFANNNLIRSNIASDTTGDGISLAQSINNDVELNQADRNGSRGIYVVGDAPAASGNALVGNTTNANNGDGTIVSKSVHTLQGNTARNNKGWGLSADPGNIDAGGNRASRNGQAAQCKGVVCAP